MADPASLPRRSFVYRRLAERGAMFGADGQTLPTDRDSGHAGVALRDLSLAPRHGFKGRASLDWLRRNGIAVPGANNRAARLGGGGLICRLAPGEAMILANADVVGRLDAAWAREMPAGCYPVPRADSHAWFKLAGRDAAPMMAKLSGVDFRPHHFDDLEIAQTFVARLPAIVVRDDMAGTVAYSLFADSASALYFWDCLVEAMAEFDGAVVGAEALGENR